MHSADNREYKHFDIRLVSSWTASHITKYSVQLFSCKVYLKHGRVAGNTVWSHMACDFPWWTVISITNCYIRVYFTFTLLTETVAESLSERLNVLTEPVMTQFLRDTNLAALTGRSHTSNDFTSCYRHTHTEYSQKNLIIYEKCP